MYTVCPKITSFVGNIYIYIFIFLFFFFSNMIQKKCLQQVKWTRLSKSVNITSDHHDVDLRDSDRFLFSASQSNVSKQIFTADLPTSRYLDGGNYSCSVDLNSTIFTDDILVDVLGERCTLIIAKLRTKRRQEIVYLTTHSTHFIYGYMASDI